jgi:hypothetical protein
MRRGGFNVTCLAGVLRPSICESEDQEKLQASNDFPGGWSHIHGQRKSKEACDTKLKNEEEGTGVYSIYTRIISRSDG